MSLKTVLWTISSQFVHALGSMGMPPLAGFIGEITVLGGAYQASPNLELSDLSFREIVVFAPLIAWAFVWIGINSQP